MSGARLRRQLQGRAAAPRRSVLGACVLVVAALTTSTTVNAAGPALVENGKARSEIVIAARPTRSARLAAHELQTGLAKISGARLPIVTAPSANVPVQVYVGRSQHTDRLGVTAEGLEHGAYRIVSGPDWLVLIGEDVDFSPTEPWARNADQVAGGKMDERWRALTGVPWGYPRARMYKERLLLPGDWGLPDAQRTGKDAESLEAWGFDERGSFNAVVGFLRGLGMRWYLPGELGEVVPSLPTIALEPVDRTERPDVAVRRFNFRFRVVGRETALWAMRLGLRDPYRLQVAHGLSSLTQHPEAFKAHPEWFALYGGKRHTDPRARNNQLCLSHQGLFENTVRLVRAQLDQYPLETVSVMPPDGFTRLCECELCRGKEHRDRGPRGRLSDYVWGFVNRVAREVKKTHPDRRVLNCAYSTYTLPPKSVRKLEPNVTLCIVGGRRPFSAKAEQETMRELREAWAQKTDNPILYFENFPFTGGGFYLPAFAPHALGASVKATKGSALGEDLWISAGRDFATEKIGFNHFIVYFTARMFWGGPGADVDALFREYCRLFYGPAAAEMLAFFEYCESNWREMAKDADLGEHALALLDKAAAKAAPASVVGRRIALIDAYLNRLRNKLRQMRQRRGVVPKVRLVARPRLTIAVDGKLDDDAWAHAPSASTGRLRELQTGREPAFATTFKVAWSGGDLYLAVRCEERPGEPLNASSVVEPDRGLWAGDAVEVLLETDAHAYYQLSVSPSGALLDVDRGMPARQGFGWSSQAEVATRVADDHWVVEMRIPVTDDDSDPLHQVVGRRPTRSLPWLINVGRRRVRPDGEEHSAFSPTGEREIEVPLKFAHFYAGRAYRFDADATVTDYLSEREAAAGMMRQRDDGAALDAFVTLAASKVTELQRSDALQQAAAAARAMKDYARADGLAELIPIAAVQRTVLMHNLLEQKKPSLVVTGFGGERLETWPFWSRGAAYLARGRAYLQTGDGGKAEKDLAHALEDTSDTERRAGVWLLIGENREKNLGDDRAAADAYRAGLEGTTKMDADNAVAAARSAARVLTRLKRHDDAIALLRTTEPMKRRGRWRGALLLALGEAQEAAGKRREARAAYRAVLADSKSKPRHRALAEERLETLGKRGR